MTWLKLNSITNKDILQRSTAMLCFEIRISNPFCHSIGLEPGLDYSCHFSRCRGRKELSKPPRSYMEEKHPQNNTLAPRRLEIAIKKDPKFVRNKKHRKSRIGQRLRTTLLYRNWLPVEQRRIQQSKSKRSLGCSKAIKDKQWGTAMGPRVKRTWLQSSSTLLFPRCLRIISSISFRNQKPHFRRLYLDDSTRNIGVGKDIKKISRRWRLRWDRRTLMVWGTARCTIMAGGVDGSGRDLLTQHQRGRFCEVPPRCCSCIRELSRDLFSEAATQWTRSFRSICDPSNQSQLSRAFLHIVYPLRWMRYPFQWYTWLLKTNGLGLGDFLRWKFSL